MNLARFLLATLLFAVPAGAQQGPRPYRPGIDVLDYDITLDLPQAGNVVNGRTILTVRRTARTDTLVLDLLALKVDSVLVNERPVRFGRDAATLRVPLAAGSGDTLKVAVRYGGAVTDGLIIRTDSLGRWTGFGDNFPDRARHWIPSVDHPSDKATVTWRVIAPTDRAVVANGVLAGRQPVAASNPLRMTTTWRESQPITTYVMVIAAAPLYEHSMGETACGLAALARCVPQSVYLEPELKSYLPGPFARVGEIVTFFATLFGPYPYEKLAHLQSSTRYGGMENSSAIFYSDAGFRRNRLSETTVAHEIAHQWFGNSVTVSAWPHLWLSEGFATYLAEMWRQKAAGDSAFREGMRAIRQDIVTDDVVARRPVIDTIETDINNLLNTNSYQKGGFVLHMLRHLVGDSAFIKGLREYQKKYRNGNALTADLQAEMEAAAGKRLGWFFDQWLRRPGWAEVETQWSYDTAAKSVKVSMRQSDRFGVFQLQVPVDVVMPGGQILRRELTVGSPVGFAEIPLDAAPTDVVFDPDVAVLATFTRR